MRVLHVIDGLGGSGGAENRLTDECLAMSGDLTQGIVRLFERDFLQPRLENRGLSVVDLGLQSHVKTWNWPTAVVRLSAVIRSFQPDVVHTSLFTANLVGQLATWRNGTPTLSTFTLTGDQSLHRAYQPGASTWQASALRNLAARVARSHPNLWYRAISEDARRTNGHSLRFPLERISVIPRGVETTKFEVTADRGRFGLPAGVPVLVNVGRHEPQKGHQELIEIFVRVLDKFPDAHLAIAGREGIRTDAIKAAIRRHGLEDRVHLLGFRSDVPWLLKSSDVFVFPSFAEGLGTATLEALAAGIPVAAFDIPPVREVIGSCPRATLVTPGDVDGAAASIANWLRSPDSGGGSMAGQNHVRSHYDLRAIAQRVETLLRSVANGAG